MNINLQLQATVLSNENGFFCHSDEKATYLSDHRYFIWPEQKIMGVDCDFLA